ncbi:MAG: P63C domain-containing protein [Candidatus Sumerlaeia bacterium]
MSENIPRAIHEGTIKLRIGDAEILIPCAVLEDGRRLLTQSGFMKALGRSRQAKGRAYYDSDVNMPAFLSAKNLTPFISDELRVTSSQIVFKPLSGNRAFGYSAELLPKVCEVFLRARDEKILLKSQEHILRQADILMRGLAHVGIIALVDEATGYQADRAKDALAKILEQFISKELAAWAKTFPDDYYKEMFRLRNLSYDEFSTKRPPYMGRLTNDIVYERLAPGVLTALKKVVRRNAKGRPKDRLFQRLSDDTGYPRLKEHLWAVIGLMRVAPNWRKFYSYINRAFPKYGSTPELPFPEPIEDGEKN